jgi:hypothetical protein
MFIHVYFLISELKESHRRHAHDFYELSRYMESTWNNLTFDWTLRKCIYTQLDSLKNYVDSNREYSEFTRIDLETIKEKVRLIERDVWRMQDAQKEKLMHKGVIMRN